MEYLYSYTCNSCGAQRTLAFDSKDGQAPAPYDVPNKLVCQAVDCEATMKRTYSTKE